MQRDKFDEPGFQTPLNFDYARLRKLPVDTQIAWIEKTLPTCKHGDAVILRKLLRYLLTKKQAELEKNLEDMTAQLAAIKARIEAMD